MPLDYQQVYTRIQAIGKHAHERRKDLEARRRVALELLSLYADAFGPLHEKVDAAKAADPGLRFAAPFAERLDAHFMAPEKLPGNTIIMAADGSQILPSRHKRLLYYLINVGVIVLGTGTGKTPDVFVETDLHYDDEDETSLPTDSQIALQRDLAERTKMLQVSKSYSGQKVALTDGQLELWGSLDPGNARQFQKSLRDYLDSLDTFRREAILTAGYVDKPSANLLVRLLEIVSVPESEIVNLRLSPPLRGVTDLWLMRQSLGKHERSAVFSFQAKTAEPYTDQIALYFFYLNVGDERVPKLARVDIPRWVAENQEHVNLLHRVLVDQSLITGGNPYPYLLHRSHEVARVTQQEENQVDRMLELAFLDQGSELEEPSAKQFEKDLPGRTRYRP